MRNLFGLARIAAVLSVICMGFAYTPSVLYAYDLPKGEEPNLDKENIAPLQKISRGISTIARHAQKGIVFVSVSKVIKGQPFGLINPFDFFFGPNQDPFNHRGPGGPGGPGGQGGPGGPRGGGKAPEYKQEGLGSGFFVDLDKGYVLTNNHVIDEADEINLKLANGETYEAKVVGRDKNTDVAIVQIKGKFDRDGIVALSLGDSSKSDVGDICVALGAPFGLEASISMGVVSAIGRGSLSITELGNFIQTDAAINPGNSGGPLLDTTGQVIGMNTAIFSRSGAYNGIGFAIPSNLARTVANQLINNGKVERGYLGVVLSPMEPDLAKELGVPRDFKGALVRTVEPTGPAAKAGIEAGDVVVKIDGKKIDGSEDLRNRIGLVKPGTSVELTFYRDAKPRDARVKLGNYTAAEATAMTEGGQEAAFGLNVSSITPASKRTHRFTGSQGVVITAVEQGSSAERAGIEVGDLIVKVNNQAVTNPKQFIGLVKDKRRLLLRLERRGQYLIVPLER